MDATDLVVDILSEALTVPVSSDMRRERDHVLPTRYVLVSKSGDQSDEYLLRPRYALTCWGTSDKDAHGIALSAVQALQEAALDHPYLFAAQLETMSREEWSRTGQSRYLCEVDLTINTDE